MDLAKVYLQAVDQTAPAFTSFKRNLDASSAGFDKIKGSLASLGVVVSAGGFAMLMKQTVDALDHLNDLSKSTDIAVERLAGLGFAAKQSGGDLDSIAQALNKLSQNMGRDAEKFKALGLSAKDPLEAFKQLSDIFNDLEDPQQRAAVMAAALGKSWAGAAPLLAEGSAKIQQLVDKGTQLTGVTQEAAEQADAFNDKLLELTGTGGLLNGVIAPMLPLLNALADDLIDLQKGSDGANTGFSMLRETLRAIVVFGGNVGFVLKGIATEIGGLTAQAVGFATSAQKILSGDFAGGIAEANMAWRIGDMMKSDAAGARARFDAWEQRMMTAGTLDTGRDNWDRMGDMDAARRRAAAAARASAFLGPEGGRAGAAKDSGYGAMLDDLRKKLDLEKESTELEKLNFALARDKYKLITEAQREELRGLAALIDARTAERAVNAAALRHAEDMVQAQERADKTLTDLNQTWSEYRQNLEAETKLYGLTETQRETAIQLRKLEIDFIKATTNATQEQYDALKAVYDIERARLPGAIAANQAARQAAEQLKKNADEVSRFNDQIGSSLTDALLRGFESGKTFAENFRDTVVNMFKTMVLRPVIQFLVSPISGAITAALAGLGIPGLAGASTGGAAGGSGGLFSLSNLGSLFSGGGDGFLSGITGAANSVFQNLGVSFGSQFIADIGNFGFGVPVIGGLMGLLSGNPVGGLASAGLGALGNLLLPGVGGVIGSVIGGLFGGGNKTPAQFTGMDMTGTITRAGLMGASFYGNDHTQGYRWLTTDHNSTGYFNDYVKKLFDEMGQLAQMIGRDASILDSRSYGFSASGLSNLDAQQIAAEMAGQLGAVSDQIALDLLPSLRELAQAGETATQTLVRVASTYGQLTAREAEIMRALPGMVSGLAGTLGITGLSGARDALAVSPYRSPLDRFSAARSQLDSVYGRAVGGDLSAVNEFPQLLQQALTIGRDVYASGPQFQELFVEGNRKLNELLAKQQALQTDLLADLPTSITEASNNQIAELRRGFKAVSDELAAVRAELRRIAA